MAARHEPVREQDAEQRDEERPEEQEELLVLRQVDAERDPRCEHRDPDDQQPLRRAREEVLHRDRSRVDVREGFVRLVHRQREQRQHRADAARSDRRQHVGRAGDRRMREHEHGAEAELEERRQQVAEAGAGERGSRIPCEPRVVGDERHPRHRERDDEIRYELKRRVVEK